MMQKLGNEVTDAEVKDIITESGSSKASGITYPEFQKLMGMGIKNLREPEDPEDELRHAFRLFDQDGDGEWHPNPDPNLNPNPGGRRRVGLLCCCSAHAAAPRRPWTLATATACPVAAPRLPCSSHALPQASSPSLPAAGFISAKELGKALANYGGFQATDKEVEQVISEATHNADRRISYDVFKRVMMSH